MTTLTNEKLYNYLEHIGNELDDRISSTDNKSLEHLIHSQMKKILIAEQEFLKYINSNGTEPILSFTGYGLPSIESLKPDLEKITELAENHPQFTDISKEYKKGVLQKESGELYSLISEEEYNKDLELLIKRKENIKKEIGFSISETPDKKFELNVREDHYIDGIDKYSIEMPRLTRKGKIFYQVAFNQLFGSLEQSFYKPNTLLILTNNPRTNLSNSIKVFDDIEKSYILMACDYPNIRKPWFTTWRRSPKIDYSELLSVGTGCRIDITKKILEILNKCFNRGISIKGLETISELNLLNKLPFLKVLFKNDPTVIPKTEELYSNLTNNYRDFDYEGYKILNPIHETRFDLLSKDSLMKIGEIDYILPHNKSQYDWNRTKIVHYFNYGQIDVRILGNSINNQLQYNDLIKQLNKLTPETRKTPGGITG